MGKGIMGATNQQTSLSDMEELMFQKHLGSQPDVRMTIFLFDHS
jgi:hypothetical protein